MSQGLEFLRDAQSENRGKTRDPGRRQQRYAARRGARRRAMRSTIRSRRADPRRRKTAPAAMAQEAQEIDELQPSCSVSSPLASPNSMRGSLWMAEQRKPGHDVGGGTRSKRRRWGTSFSRSAPV